MGVKTYNNPFYWQNRLDKNNLIEPITEKSIFCYEAFIDCNGESVVRWSCYPDAKATLGYIQNIVMPTIYFSHFVSRTEGVFITPDCTTYEMIEALEESTKYSVDVEKLELAQKQDDFLTSLWELTDEEIIEKLKEFQKEVIRIWRCELSYFTYFEIYESPLEIFEATVKDYEGTGALAQLEEALGMTKSEWLNTCTNTHESRFMQLKFIDILNNRLGKYSLSRLYL